MKQQDYIKQLDRVDSLKKEFDRTRRSPNLMKRKEDLSNMWLNHRKMNLSKRTKSREKILDTADNSAPAKATATDFPIGNMYLFQYDAETKKTLDYWDIYPLILPFSFNKGLMYGMNLHYMPRDIRLRVLSALDDSISGKNRMAPNILVQNLSQLDLFKPSIHSYYSSNMASNFLKIEPAEWENVLFLPVQKFVSDKGDKGRRSVSLSKVYADYLKKI